jgi:transcriptional regulator with XRE-family HTH domain
MPTVRRRRLIHELRRLREVAGLTCEQVAGQLECSASKISRIETGRVSASPRDVRDLLGIYGVPDEQRDSLIQLARDSRQKGWWQAYGDIVEPHLATYLGMESTASEISVYRACRLPGLVQTEDYARTLIVANSPDIAHPGDQRTVAYRMERQQQAKARQPRLRLVMDEAALRRQVGGREVMRAQLGQLIRLTAESGVLLQIIPFTGGAYIPIDMPFAILAFPDRADPDVVCLRYATGTLWIEDMLEVDRYNVLFCRLQAAALSPVDSAALMTSVLNDL